MFRSIILFLVVLSSASIALTEDAIADANREYSEGTKIVNGVCYEWVRIITRRECDDLERYWTRPCGYTGAMKLEWDGILRNGSFTGTPISYDPNGNGLVPVVPGSGGNISSVTSPVGWVSFSRNQSSTVFIEASVFTGQDLVCID